MTPLDEPLSEAVEGDMDFGPMEETDEVYFDLVAHAEKAIEEDRRTPRLVVFNEHVEKAVYAIWQDAAADFNMRLVVDNTTALGTLSRFLK